MIFGYLMLVTVTGMGSFFKGAFKPIGASVVLQRQRGIQHGFVEGVLLQNDVSCDDW